MRNPVPRSSLELSPRATTAMSPLFYTGQLPDPVLGKNTHPITLLHPNQSPNATLPAGIFFVLRLQKLATNPRKGQLSPRLVCCSNNVSSSNKLCSPLILPHAWTFFSNPCTDHDIGFVPGLLMWSFHTANRVLYFYIKLISRVACWLSSGQLFCGLKNLGSFGGPLG